MTEERKCGRPRIIETPERMDELVQDYQRKALQDDEPITLTGLIIHLGLSSRQSFDEYQKRPEFSDSVKRAKLLVENTYEKQLRNPAAAGSIFALKNFGWKDRTEHDVNLSTHEAALDDLE